MTDSAGLVAVLRALVDVNEAFIEIAGTLRAQPGVTWVARPCTMRRETPIGEDRYAVGHGEGFRFEWYADAMLTTGRAISFATELSWHAGEYQVEARVTTSDKDTEDTLLDLPTRHATDPDDLVVQLSQQTRHLLDQHVALVERFLTLPAG